MGSSAHADRPDPGGPSSVRPFERHTQLRRKKRHPPVLSGFLVPHSQLREEPLPRPSGHLKLRAVNFRTEAEVDLYGPDGGYDDEALDTLNHLWRCRRTGTEKPIDPHLFEILSAIQDHFDGRTIELVSGFRNQKRTTSFHFHGSAADIRIPGVSEKTLHSYVGTLDIGGMGLGRYPRAGFIHVDVRPEPSYRWTDYSAPNENMGHPHRKRRKASNS